MGGERGGLRVLKSGSQENGNKILGSQGGVGLLALCAPALGVIIHLPATLLIMRCKL
jgi:hypothetical protein